jgi:4-azaleucine resistance transporter AzlC
LRDFAALAVPIAAFGLVFGVLAVQAGLAPWLAVLSSVIVLSGAAQFAMVGLLAAGPGAVLVATTGLALRHIPMSATMARLFADAPLHRRLHLAFVLVDESFGLTIKAADGGEPDLVSYKTAIDIGLFSTWVTATALGTALGTEIDPSRWGLEVWLPLLFLGLAAPLVKSWRDMVTALASAAAAVGAVLVLPAAWRVTAAAVIGALIGSTLRE